MLVFCLKKVIGKPRKLPNVYSKLEIEYELLSSVGEDKKPKNIKEDETLMLHIRSCVCGGRVTRAADVSFDKFW